MSGTSALNYNVVESSVIDDAPSVESTHTSPLHYMGEYRGVKDTHDNENDRICTSQTIEALTLNKASWLSSYINLTSTIVGAGYLVMPYAFAKTGYVLGVVIFVCAGSLSWFGLHLLSSCAKKTVPPSSFYAVAKITAPQLSLLIDISIVIKCIGIATSYLMVVGDLLPMAMEQFNAMNILRNRRFCVAVGLMVVGPISFLPSLDALKYTSLISGVMILSIGFLIILFSLHLESPLLAVCRGSSNSDGDFAGNDQCFGRISAWTFTANTPKVLGIFFFGFSCQQNTFTVANELQRPTQARMDSVFFASIGSVILFYTAICSAAYLTFGDTLSGDILEAYPENILTTTARLGVCFIVMCHYPLQLHPARACMLSIFQNLDKGIAPSPSVYKMRFVSITVVCLVLTTVIAITFSDLGVTLSVVGATGSTLVICIVPGLLYYLMCQNSVHDPNNAIKKYGAAGSCLFGLCFAPFCLYYIFTSV